MRTQQKKIGSGLKTHISSGFEILNPLDLHYEHKKFSFEKI